MVTQTLRGLKDNLPLRRALALAINREILTERVTGAGEIPAYGWVPPVTDYQGQQMLGADWDQQSRNEAAVEYYQQAGYFKVTLLSEPNHKQQEGEKERSVPYQPIKALINAPEGAHPVRAEPCGNPERQKT